MLVIKSNIPCISHLKPKAICCFMAGSLVGRDSNKTIINRKVLSVLARLIDKAITEYNFAKEAIETEEIENKLTYEEIIARNQWQFLYTCVIINHLENCITTLARIYKIANRYLSHEKKKELIDIRDSIEHIDQRIWNTDNEPPTLNISEDSLAIEIAYKNSGKISIKTDDIAKEIICLYNMIIGLLKN